MYLLARVKRYVKNLFCTIEDIDSPLDGDPGQYHGLCSVCGWVGCFERNHRSLREGFACKVCNSSLRYRGQADVLLKLFGQSGIRCLAELVKKKPFRSLKIFEPGVIGPLRPLLSKVEMYSQSYYWEDVKLGGVRDNIGCQNLETLTFEDNNFDLIITSDIFEHIRRPWDAFEEIFRVLKPGGYHVFSIPVQKPLRENSVERVDTTGDVDRMLVEPHYHSAPGGGRALVYTDFGSDIIARLADLGFITTQYSPLNTNVNVAKLVTFSSLKPEVNV